MTSEKIIGYVSEQFGVDKDSLSRDTSFVDDLNADSLDVVELSMTIEDEFGIGEISEEDLKNIKTIGDLVDYVEHASGNCWKPLRKNSATALVTEGFWRPR